MAKGLRVLAVAPPRREIAEQSAAVAAGRRQRPILVVAIAGAPVPTRPDAAPGHRPGRKKHRPKRAHWQGQWHEAKGVRCYLLAADRLVHLLSGHQIQSEEEVFGPCAKSRAKSRA